MGHPKSIKDKRLHQLHVRLNPADKAVLAAAAKRSNFGGDVSAWARVTLLNAAAALHVDVADLQAEVAALEKDAADKEAKEAARAAKKKSPKAEPPPAVGAHENGPVYAHAE